MITVLLASYNGAKYLPQQIESLLEQSEQRFTIVACDDCSTDDSYKILKEYAAKYPEKISVRQTIQNTGNARDNFFQLMLEFQDEYLMLCDQDDVWLPDKIEKSLGEIMRVERQCGKNTPVLVHTDLNVVNEDLTLRHQSYVDSMNGDTTRHLLRQAVVQNIVTGCTVIYNRSLAQMLTESPQFAVMHDWWIYLVAVCFGRVSYLPDQTILYRQHVGNSVGSKNVRSLRYKINRLCYPDEMHQALFETYQQAETFLNIYYSRLSDAQRKLLLEYSQIPSKSKLLRIARVLQLGTLKHGVARQLATFWII